MALQASHEALKKNVMFVGTQEEVTGENVKNPNQSMKIQKMSIPLTPQKATLIGTKKYSKKPLRLEKRLPIL